MNRKHFAAFSVLAAAAAVATPALAQGAVAPKWQWLAFSVFGAIIAATMFVTYLAAKRVKSAADFYTAGGGVSGLQNGWAIAGDYLSAASDEGTFGRRRLPAGSGDADRDDSDQPATHMASG